MVPRAKVEGDLYDLCRPGWALDRRPADITLFKNGGGGHLDLFTALFIRDRLRPWSDANSLDSFSSQTLIVINGLIGQFQL